MNYKLKNSRILLWSITSILVFIIISLGTIAIISTQNTITPVGIVIHHSAVPFPPDGSPIDVKAIDEIHQRKGYGIFYWGRTYHVGYHYIILPDGNLQQGRPENCKGAHTTGYNNYTGICLIGDFSPSDNINSDKGPQEPTRKQMETLINLVRRLRSDYNIPTTNIHTHHELNPETECPGENFPIGAFLNKVSN